MKKRMDQVSQESVEVGHVSHLEQLEQPKNNPKEVVTFIAESKMNWRTLLQILLGKYMTYRKSCTKIVVPQN
jgi:hypothetical protein